MGRSPLPLSGITFTWTTVHLGATNLVSNHSVINLYLDNTFQHLKVKSLTVSQNPKLV